MKNKVAFVVVGWNNKKLLKDCFDSILAQTYKNIVVYYVDNNSTDDSLEYVKKNKKQINCIASTVNSGFAKGNNIGISEALKDRNVKYIALLNTDARIEKTWTEKLVRFGEGKKDLAAMQGVTLNYYNNKIIDSTHLYLARNGQAAQGNSGEKYTGFKKPFEVFGVNCAAAMFTREFIESQPYKQFFDETMFMYLEDVDVALRTVILGYKNYCVVNAKAYHMGSVSSKKDNTFPTYMIFRNNSGLIVKNLSFRLIFRLIPRIIKSDYIASSKFKKNNHKNQVKALRKGRIVGLFYIPIFFAKRVKIIGKRKVKSSYVWELMKNGKL